MHRGLPCQNFGWAMANLAHPAAPPMLSVQFVKLRFVFVRFGRLLKGHVQLISQLLATLFLSAVPLSFVWHSALSVDL